MPGAEIWEVAIDSLRANKVKAFLTMLGVVIGSTCIVLVVTISLVGRQYILAQIEGVGSNLVYAELIRTGAQSATLADELTLSDLAAVRREIGEADGWLRSDACQQRQAEHDEQNDSDDFDHREPILEAAKTSDAAGVDVQQGERESQDPKPFWRVWEPPLAIDRDGDCFAPDRDALRRPVGVAHGEAGPGIQIQLGVDSERSRGGMSHCHL